MKYIFKNIGSLAKKEPAVFSMLIICVLVSAFLSNFTYGLYRNYLGEYYRAGGENEAFTVTAAEDARLTKGEFMDFVMHIPERSRDRIGLYFVKTFPLYIDIDLVDELVDERDQINLADSQEGAPEGKFYYNSYIFRFAVKEGKIVRSPSCVEAEELQSLILDGRALTDEDELTGAYNMVISHESTLSLGDEYLLWGKKYTIVGKKQTIFGAEMPIITMPDHLEIKSCDFCTYETMIVTKEIFDDIKNAADEVIPGKLIFPQLDLPDDSALTLFRNIMLVSGLIAVFTSINFALLFLFVMRKRRHALAIMQICGATRSKAARLYIGECLVLTVPTFWLGTLIFDILLKNVFSKMFNFMQDAFTPFVYPAVFGVFMLVTMITVCVLIFRNVKTDIKKTLTEGRI